MDRETAALTLEPTTQALIASLPAYDPASALALSQRLREAGHSSQVIAAALTQSRLTAAASVKFGEFAKGMAFTQEGLEQASRLTVAALHAQRYRQAGASSVADLTCGLGADAMAMAALGLDVTAFELDEPTAMFADHNLRHWDNARVVHADSLATLAAGNIGVEGVFADPARRNAKGRRHDPKDYSPALDSVLALRSRFPLLGLKLGPGVPHDALPADAEREWLSIEGDVVEVGVWFGGLARHEGHAALVIKDATAHRFVGEVVPGEVGTLGAFVLEPDGAVIRAGLVGPLADELGAHLLAPDIAYLTTDAPSASPFVSAFRVVEALPFSEKRLADALRARGIGRLEIKKRGMDVLPEQLRPRLKLKGQASATVILTRVGSSRMAIIAERVEHTATH